MRTLIIVSALGLLAAATTTSAQPRPMTTLDLISIDRVSDPQVSPDGSRVTFVLSELDLEADGRLTDLWITNVAGGTPRRLTTDPAGEIRVFVYSSTTGEGGGQGSSRRDLGLKHEVSADRAGFR